MGYYVRAYSLVGVWDCDYVKGDWRFWCLSHSEPTVKVGTINCISIIVLSAFSSSL